VQRRLLVVVDRGAAVVGTSHGGVGLAVVVADGVGRHPWVGAADRLQAAVAGDGDGAVVA
jgi:hypothetical protein